MRNAHSNSALATFSHVRQWFARWPRGAGDPEYDEPVSDEFERRMIARETARLNRTWR